KYCIGSGVNGSSCIPRFGWNRVICMETRTRTLFCANTCERLFQFFGQICGFGQLAQFNKGRFPADIELTQNCGAGTCTECLHEFASSECHVCLFAVLSSTVLRACF